MEFIFTVYLFISITDSSAFTRTGMSFGMVILFCHITAYYSTEMFNLPLQ